MHRICVPTALRGCRRRVSAIPIFISPFVFPRGSRARLGPSVCVGEWVWNAALCAATARRARRNYPWNNRVCRSTGINRCGGCTEVQVETPRRANVLARCNIWGARTRASFANVCGCALQFYRYIEGCFGVYILTHVEV